MFAMVANVLQEPYGKPRALTQQSASYMSYMQVSVLRDSLTAERDAAAASTAVVRTEVEAAAAAELAAATAAATKQWQSRLEAATGRHMAELQVRRGVLGGQRRWGGGVAALQLLMSVISPSISPRSSQETQQELEIVRQRLAAAEGELTALRGASGDMERLRQKVCYRLPTS